MSLTASLSAAFLQAFARVQPTQLQIYGASEGRMRLQIVASIAHVTSIPRIDDEGRVHCLANVVFRAIRGGWQTESAGDLTFPGTIDRTIVHETAHGRLVLQFPLPEDAAVVVFFSERDPDAHEPYRGTDLVISRMSLDAIAMQAHPPVQAAIETGRPPDDD